MKFLKRFASIVLVLTLIFSFFSFVPQLKSEAAFSGVLQFNEKGKFRIIQIADVQDKASVNSRAINVITKSLARYQPDLVVFTGDNIAGSISTSNFQSSVNAFTQPLLDANVKFAVTFGNHDDEGNWPNKPPSKDDQYAYYKQRGGDLFIDHDVQSLTGAGNGVIEIYPRGQTSGTPGYLVYVMDSGAYASSGYDCCYTDQINYYIQTAQTYPTVPAIQFQHIIVNDVYDLGMTTSKPTDNSVGYVGHGTPYGSSTYYLIPERINWEKSAYGTTEAQIYKEKPCPANKSTYESTAHRSSSQYGSKTLYEAWRDYGNFKGAYFGHDHMNSFTVTTPDGIDLGFGKSAGVNSYNDGNPGVRVFDLDIDGSYTSYTATESDLNNAQTVFFDANGGSGGMNPQLINKDQSANLSANKFSNGAAEHIGWGTSPTSGVVYNPGASFPVGTSDHTLYAQWGQTVQITFDANGGTGGQGQTEMAVGQPLQAPSVSKLGYTLSGWSPALPSTVPSVNTVYKAQWTPITYNINYSGNGHTSGSTASSTHTYDTSKSLTPNGFLKYGYEFLGWSTQSGAVTPVYEDMESVLNLASTQGSLLTFYAIWELGSYTQTFDANGGQGSTSVTQTYDTSLNPPFVYREGHTFTHWDPAVPDKVPGYNATYVAQWQKNTYNITFNADGGQGGTVKQVLYGETPIPPTVTKDGYVFAGWSPNIGPVTGDAVYVAKWTSDNYMITFDANGGTGGSASLMPYGAPLSAPAVSRDGYTLSGWLPAVPATVPGKDSTYTAQWTANKYQITFDANGGTGGSTQQMAHGATLTAPVVTRDGYTFLGWEPEVPDSVPAKDTTYTAKWQVDGNNLYFLPNGGSGGSSDLLTPGSKIDSPLMTRQGYIFTGWNPDLPSVALEGVHSYSAQWAPNKYYVTFDANGGSGSTGALMTYGDTLDAPTITREGYSFTGWSPALSSTVPAENITYVAQWTPTKLKYTFNANGGSGGTEILLSPGENVQIPAVSREGYIFVGWSPAVPSKAVGGSQTFTAQWLKD
ncbi:MAG: hypothetical protein GX345_04480 [Clostridiales bacterium]|nr:hypothetical protein [Clostridiales bacterium]